MPKDKAIEFATKLVDRGAQCIVQPHDDVEEYDHCPLQYFDKFFGRAAKIVLIIDRNGQHFAPVN